MGAKNEIANRLIQSISNPDEPWEFDAGIWTFAGGVLSMGVSQARTRIYTGHDLLFEFTGGNWHKAFMLALSRRKEAIEDREAEPVLPQIKRLLQLSERDMVRHYSRD
jgi:hypothetical protein